MSPREARAIRNEELFREVNLRIVELEDDLPLSDEGLMPLVCECVHTGCTEPLAIDLATFERVHEKPLRFFVTPGHEDLTVESIIERHEGYLVVEKGDV